MDILRKSQTRNHQAGISGLLLFRGQHFLQFIEGPVAEVERLFERISRDARHSDVRLLSKNASERLVMPTWAMAYTSPAQDHASSREAFTLGQREALAVCELLPAKIARPFLDLLVGEAGAA